MTEQELNREIQNVNHTIRQQIQILQVNILGQRGWGGISLNQKGFKRHNHINIQFLTQFIYLILD